MAISLTQIIAALEAKANTTDSASSISDVLRLSIGAEAVSDGTIIYDSAGVMPTDSAFIGTMAAASNGTIYFYNGTAWNAVDSAETIAAAAAYSFQGSVSGYNSGGSIGPPSIRNVIQKFSFTSDGNSTDVGDLTATRYGSGGQSSSNDGYTSGGSTTAPISVTSNVIDKFPFAADANATDVGDLTLARVFVAGHSSSTNGYTSGGRETSTNAIDKFPFAVDANATDVGDLIADLGTGGIRYEHAGHSSTDYGYIGGGLELPGGNYTNAIQKFSFTIDGNSTDVGDLTVARRNIPAGQSSDASGYTSGGADTGTTLSNVIDKFPFSSDANATDVGDLSLTRRYVTGTSSTASGYSSGGRVPNSTYTDTIDKFPFSSDANATDVGNLLSTNSQAAGQQV